VIDGRLLIVAQPLSSGAHLWLRLVQHMEVLAESEKCIAITLSPDNKIDFWDVHYAVFSRHRGMGPTQNGQSLWIGLFQHFYQLKALGMAGTVLHLGAHPDDEDVGLMAYMARKMGVRIVYWSATRGEGGEAWRSATSGCTRSA